MDVHRRLLIVSPQYRAARDRIETLAFEFERGRRAVTRTEVVRIPVVVHVVWNLAEQNISDAQVQSQIAALNRDYRRTNADVSTVPEVWQSLVADTQIEFFLATRDPDGKPTNGVTRTETSTASFGNDDNVKSTSSGGTDPWPTDRYLNIWVCKLSGGLLGFAQFPGGPASTDGVVITTTAFGTMGTATAPFNLGRTATHEVGHWLNLLHIWGDDGTGCGGSDEVADTPNQAGPNKHHPTFPSVTCDNGPNGDMFVNYMDYVDDDSMTMFTTGQATRMEACLQGPRKSFLVEQGPPGVGVPATSGSGGVGSGIVASGSNRIDLFVVGIDSSLYHKWLDDLGWNPSIDDYDVIRAVCSTPAEVVSQSSGRLDVFFLGIDSFLYHGWLDGSGWHPAPGDWERLGGQWLGQPVAVSWGSGRIDGFALGTDSSLYHGWLDESGWHPAPNNWKRLGGGPWLGRPVAVSWGSGRLDVLILGIDSSLYHGWLDGSGWHPTPGDWERLGGQWLGRPAAVSWGSGRLDVFILGIDSSLYHGWLDGSGWHPGPGDWERLGGTWLGQPVAVSRGPGRLDLFLRGTDSSLHHGWLDGSGWHPGPGEWENLGGEIGKF